MTLTRKTAYTFIICAAFALPFASCGRQHNAEQTVKGFMEANLNEPSSLEQLHFEGMDSTRHITDSAVSALRKAAQASAKQYKADINYTTGKASPSTIFIKATYKSGGKRYADTYYLDPSLDAVVAFMSRED